MYGCACGLHRLSCSHAVHDLNQSMMSLMQQQQDYMHVRCCLLQDSCSQQFIYRTYIQPSKMADVSPRLELVFVDRFWEWNAGKGLPKKSSWLPMSQEQQRNVREERDLLTLLPDNRTLTKISELDSGIKLFQSEGQ